MLSTIYAQKILGGNTSLPFVAQVMNGHADIYGDVVTAINGWCSNEAVYKAWDKLGRPDTEDFMPPFYDTISDPEQRRSIIAEARITAMQLIIEDQLYGLIIDKLFSGKLITVPAALVEGPEDPHGVSWVEGGIPGIIECDCYIMKGGEE